MTNNDPQAALEARTILIESGFTQQSVDDLLSAIVTVNRFSKGDLVDDLASSVAIFRPELIFRMAMTGDDPGPAIDKAIRGMISASIVTMQAIMMNIIMVLSCAEGNSSYESAVKVEAALALMFERMGEE